MVTYADIQNLRLNRSLLRAYEETFPIITSLRDKAAKKLLDPKILLEKTNSQLKKNIQAIIYDKNRLIQKDTPTSAHTWKA